VIFTIDAANDEAVPGNGSLSIEEGNFVNLKATLKSKTGERITMTEECYGKKMSSSVDNHRVEALYEEKSGRSSYNIYLSRVGDCSWERLGPGRMRRLKKKIRSSLLTALIRVSREESCLRRA
jgi:hypothetical protein